jgi:hypothetical protein
VPFGFGAARAAAAATVQAAASAAASTSVACREAFTAGASCAEMTIATLASRLVADAPGATSRSGTRLARLTAVDPA